jgi:rod shape determining protein RodA
MNVSYKSPAKSFDYISLLLIILLSLCGLMCIFSATYRPEKIFSSFFIKQIFGVISGLIIYFLCLLPDYRNIMRWGYAFYIGVIALLIITLIKGSIGMGGQRWINLYFFKFQPSELSKLFFPAFMVNYVHLQKKTIIQSFYFFAPILVVLLLSFILIHKQPDLGTALILLTSGIILLWLAGISKKFFLYSILCILLISPFIWSYALHPYQKNRILVFCGYGNQKSERYQIEQARIAIGSGGIFGKGLCKGTQNRLRFLPESRTDFIFAVLCEEMGLIGAVIVVLLYLFLFFRSFMLIKVINDEHAQLFAVGLLVHLLLATLINIGMVLGMLPIVGIPLPFMSYGLSNLLITYTSFGIIHNIILYYR